MAGTVTGYRHAVTDTTTALAGRYVLGPELGRGGMATVHEGRDLVLDRPVAVKILAPPFDRDRGFVERFRREASAAARLNHPNVVAVFDSGSDGDRHFIVTELVEGETLAASIARDGPSSPGRTVDVAGQVCRALAAAHEAGIVHRDVKPGNVMLAADGTVKVVDFGIAKAAGDGAITLSGTLLGSAPYLSPEQARGEQVDERTDLYSLGCVMYEMLTGRPPFLADTPVATMYQHVNEAPEPPSSIRPVPEGIESIVMRCLEKRPDRRFGSATEMERALQTVEVPTTTLPLPLPMPAEQPTAPIPRTSPTAPLGRARVASGPPGRRRALVTAGLVAGLVGLAAFAAVALDDPGPFPPADAAPRSAGGPGPSVTGSPDPATSDAASPVAGGVPDVPAVYGDLVEAISSEGVAPDAASKLRDHADKLYEHYREGKVEDIANDAEELLRELEGRAAEGEVSQDAALAIGAAFETFLDAIDASPPPPPDDGEGDGEEDD